MHEIPPHVEAKLREHGVTDAELDELRRTGRLERSDDAGNTLQVNVASMSTTSSSPTTISLDGLTIGAAGQQIPQESLDQLRKFHQFIPNEMRDQLETAFGQDLDGDGHIGPAPVTTSSTARSDVTSGAMPTNATSGPFVGASRHGRNALIAVGVALAVVVVWMLLH